jgi:hypothetical protein
MTLEIAIEEPVCKYARTRYGMLTPKFAMPGRRGANDRIIITLQGLVAWVEFKKPGAWVIPDTPQERWLNSLVEHRCEVFIINDLEKGKSLVDLISDAARYTAWKYKPAEPSGLSPVPGPGAPAHPRPSSVDAVDGDESGQNSGDPDKHRRTH